MSELMDTYTLKPFQVAVMAAGKGTRMKSEHTPKVLHKITGRPLITHVINAAFDAGAKDIINILGHGRVQVQEVLDATYPGKSLHTVVQHEQKGTGHAIFIASEALENGPEYTLILSGDVPNLSAETITRFVFEAQQNHTLLSVMTAVLDDPKHYGRIIRRADDTLERIVEYKDANREEKKVCEINAGIYVIQTEFLVQSVRTLCSLEVTNAQGEYYLTDLIAMAAKKESATAFKVSDLREIQGINTRADLARAQVDRQKRINDFWLSQGVTMIDPARTYLDDGVRLESDIILHPNTELCGQTTVGKNTVIEQGCVIKDTHIGENAYIKAHTYATEAMIGDQSQVGPFAHLRPGTQIGKKCKIGNFVETKKTIMADGAKASHLTYLGDAQIGEYANIGAGTITCNYDGKNKHRTIIGKHAFIGSNTALVAPVNIEDNSYVGAGSVITQDVPKGALGVARSRHKNIEGWAKRK